MRVPLIIWIMWFSIGMGAPFFNGYAQEKTDFHSELKELPPSELLKLYKTTTQPTKRDAIVDTLLSKRESSIAVLRQNLVAGTEEQKLVSMGLLIEMREKESGEVLINLLKDESPRVQRQAAYALGYFKYGRSYEDLVSMLKPAQDQGVIKSVLAGLGMLGRREAIPLIRPWLSHSDASVRVNAAISLAALGSEEGLSEVIKASKSEDNQTRREGTFGLGFFKESEARSRLQDIIADPKAPWKTEALIALSRMDLYARTPQERVDLLQKRLTHPNKAVRKWAIDEISELGTPEAVRILQSVANDTSMEGRYAKRKLSILESAK